MIFKLECDGVNQVYLGTVCHDSFEKAKQLLIDEFQKVIGDSFKVKESESVLEITLNRKDAWTIGNTLSCISGIHGDPPNIYYLSLLKEKPGIDITNTYHD